MGGTRYTSMQDIEPSGVFHPTPRSSLFFWGGGEGSYPGREFAIPPTPGSSLFLEGEYPPHPSPIFPEGSISCMDVYLVPPIHLYPPVHQQSPIKAAPHLPKSLALQVSSLHHLLSSPLWVSLPPPKLSPKFLQVQKILGTCKNFRGSLEFSQNFYKFQKLLELVKI